MDVILTEIVSARKEIAFKIKFSKYQGALTIMRIGAPSRRSEANLPAGLRTTHRAGRASQAVEDVRSGDLLGGLNFLLFRPSSK